MSIALPLTIGGTPGTGSANWAFCHTGKRPIIVTRVKRNNAASKRRYASDSEIPESTGDLQTRSKRLALRSNWVSRWPVRLVKSTCVFVV